MLKYSLTDFAKINGVFRFYGVVKVHPLPDQLKEQVAVNGFCRAGRCYDNAFAIVHSGLFDDAVYVLAIASKILPVQHAIVKIGGYYFDPTWEMNQSTDDVFDLDSDYLVIAEWNKSALHQVILETKSSDGNYYAPMISTVRQLL